MAKDETNKKGFGGFDDLVSDVSNDLGFKPAQSQSRANPSQTTDSTNNPQPPNNNPKPQSPPNSTSGAKRISSGGWAWVIGIFIFIVIYANANKKNESAVPVVPYDKLTSSSYSTSTEADTATELTSSIEDMPPYGTNLVLSSNQIRYCLSEDIRLQTIKDKVNNYSDYEVSSFNSAITDYNSRCGQFKYKGGVLESVRGEVEANRSILEVEGIDRLNDWRAMTQSDSVSQSYNPPAYDPPADEQPSYSYESPEESEESNLDTAMDMTEL